MKEGSMQWGVFEMLQGDANQVEDLQDKEFCSARLVEKHMVEEEGKVWIMCSVCPTSRLVNLQVVEKSDAGGIRGD